MNFFIKKRKKKSFRKKDFDRKDLLLKKKSLIENFITALK